MATKRIATFVENFCSNMTISKSKISISIVVLVLLAAIWSTAWVNSYIRLVNYSPTNKEYSLEDYFADKAWLFSILKIGGEIPLYNVEPNVDGLGPALTKSVTVAGKKIVVESVPYDSLTCIVEKFKNTNFDTLKTVDWTDCKFKKSFPWGFSTGDAQPKINVSLSALGWILVFSSIFVPLAGFIILLCSLHSHVLSFLKSCDE